MTTVNDGISVYSFWWDFFFFFPWKQIKHLRKTTVGFYQAGKKKWRNLNFHLELNLFVTPGAWRFTSGEPWQSPRLSLETSRRKCATEWKWQHSQPSQIASESIYSTVGKTRDQALIMRDTGGGGQWRRGVRERVREREGESGELDTDVYTDATLLYLMTSTRQKSQHLFLFTPLESSISGDLCASALWCSV